MTARKKPAQDATDGPESGDTAASSTTPALGAPEPRGRVLGPEEPTPAQALSGKTFADRARARKALEDKAVAAEDTEGK